MKKILTLIVGLGAVIGIARHDGFFGATQDTPIEIGRTTLNNRTNTTDKVRVTKGGTVITNIVSLDEGASLLVTLTYYNAQGVQSNQTTFTLQEVGESSVGLNQSSRSANDTIDVRYEARGRVVYESLITETPENKDEPYF